MSEKMFWSEAESVVRAYRAEHGATAEVDVARLAHALGTDIAEIRRLAGRRRRFTDRSGVLSAGIALALTLAALGIVGPRAFAAVPMPTIPPPALAVTIDGPSGPPIPDLDFRKGSVPVDELKKLVLRERIEMRDGKPVHLDEPL